MIPSPWSPWLPITYWPWNQRSFQGHLHHSTLIVLTCMLQSSGDVCNIWLTYSGLDGRRRLSINTCHDASGIRSERIWRLRTLSWWLMSSLIDLVGSLREWLKPFRHKMVWCVRWGCDLLTDLCLKGPSRKLCICWVRPHQRKSKDYVLLEDECLGRIPVEEPWCLS